MRKLRQGKSDYDYVELMACPSGCINGGGQIKVSQLNEREGDVGPAVVNNQELVQIVSKIFHTRRDAGEGDKAFKEVESAKIQAQFGQFRLDKGSQFQFVNDNWLFCELFKAIPKDSQSVGNLKW
mmetsp:Transcript_18091/g.30884  ORF Transcript_18091/g.30884 Transcript_18091/m.30884 type:complete len:125 (-) Transcript_18091:19-393(-)